MVFIFCLWCGGGNDSIIVLSAQHSLPISVHNSAAAGCPHLLNLDAHLCPHWLEHHNSAATVAKRNHKQNGVHVCLQCSSFAQAFCYLSLAVELRRIHRAAVKHCSHAWRTEKIRSSEVLVCRYADLLCSL